MEQLEQERVDLLYPGASTPVRRFQHKFRASNAMGAKVIDYYIAIVDVEYNLLAFKEMDDNYILKD